MSKVNTSKNIGAKEVSETELKAQIEAAAKAIKSEELVEVSIPKLLEKNIGQTLFLGINGVSIVLPVDGKDYKIPAPFAAQLKEYLGNLQN